MNCSASRSGGAICFNKEGSGSVSGCCFVNCSVRSRFDTTILFITHDVDEAIYLADRVVVMDRKPGRIKEIVKVDLPHPRNRSSAEFIDLQDKIEELLGVWED